MSKLISGKEALIALANGEAVEYNSDGAWWEIDGNCALKIFDQSWDYRIKPRTITINGIEVPAPFKPKTMGEQYFFLYPSNEEGYGMNYFDCDDHETWMQFGAWRSEDEIKQVVSALRSILSKQT